MLSRDFWPRSGLLVLSLAALAAAPPENQRPTNRLAKETSPYLLQHAHNPVDWYPWGPEAFAKARAEKKPIFLSVGYSSCYWCHVMERESFEDAEIARTLNGNFVCIKVDREERPDVDQIYMTALQALGPGGGGWPMSMFLIPDGRPFFGVTYLPPRDRAGSTGFLTLLGAIAKGWTTDRANIEKAADELTEAVRDRLRAEQGRKLALSRDWATRGLDLLAEQFDAEYGGFGFSPASPRRPKFPEPVNLLFLLDRDRRSKKEGAKSPVEPMTMLRTTLDHMARGGIRDHLGGGYHRYSTDRYWAVPHFEKMLYDNAQLATAHVLAFEATGDPRWRAEVDSTFAFIERKLTSPEGGFYSSLDAETKAGEGAYYVWTRDEVKAALGEGPELDLFARFLGLNGEPNFEDRRYVLHEPAVPSATDEVRLSPIRARLLAVRENRPAPRLDDKILTAWNGLTIAAYAEGYRVLRTDAYRRTAEKAAGFLLAKLRTPDGGLLRTYRDGQARLKAYLEDYAFLAHGLLRLHAATGDVRWLREARSLTDRMIADFEDTRDGGFFFTADDHESLLARSKDPIDNALPSGNAIAIIDLLALHELTRESSYREHAAKALGAFSTTMARLPHAVPMMLLGLETYLDGERAPAPLTPSLEPQASEVSATVRVEKPIVPPGGTVEAVVSLVIADGWHLYAHEADPAESRPTTLRLDPAARKSAELLEVSYPSGASKALASIGTGKVPLYEGKIEIRARLHVSDRAMPGPMRCTLTLDFQACNDRLCRAPGRISIPVELEIQR